MFAAADSRASISMQIVEDILSIIGGKTNEARASLAYKRWLEVQKSFWRYSWNNALLIAQQSKTFGFNPTRVAGSTKWNKMGRKVIKEEWNNKIYILAPSFKEVMEKGELKKKLIGFRSVYVFDQKQTEGDPLPELQYRVSGDDKGLCFLLEKIYLDKGITLEYHRQDTMNKKWDGAKGVCVEGKAVHVSMALKGIEKASTLIHELAHSMLHFSDDFTLSSNHQRSIAEIEAESVTACVLGACGFKWEPSALYLACWGGDIDKIEKSMSRISSTAKKILEELEGIEED
jgi:hypothetical protein